MKYYYIIIQYYNSYESFLLKYEWVVDDVKWLVIYIKLF